MSLGQLCVQVLMVFMTGELTGWNCNCVLFWERSRVVQLYTTCLLGSIYLIKWCPMIGYACIGSFWYNVARDCCCLGPLVLCDKVSITAKSVVFTPSKTVNSELAIIESSMGEHVYSYNLHVCVQLYLRSNLWAFGSREITIQMLLWLPWTEVVMHFVADSFY